MANIDKLIAVAFNAMKYTIEHDTDECLHPYKYTLSVIRNGGREKVEKLTPEMIAALDKNDMVEGLYSTINAGVNVVFRTDYFIKGESILHSVDGFTDKPVPEEKMLREKEMHQYLNVFLDEEQDEYLDRNSEEYKKIKADILQLAEENL